MSKNRADKRPAEFPDAQGNNREVGYGKPPAHTRWRNGQSGNPAGRPRSAALSGVQRRCLAEVDTTDPEGRNFAEVIADRLIAKAIGGDVAAAKEIADRTEGKARQAVTLTYDKREKLERAVRHIMDDAQCTREEAVKALAVFQPEAMELLNTD